MLLIKKLKFTCYIQRYFFRLCKNLGKIFINGTKVAKISCLICLCNITSKDFQIKVWWADIFYSGVYLASSFQILILPKNTIIGDWHNVLIGPFHLDTSSAFEWCSINNTKNVDVCVSIFNNIVWNLDSYYGASCNR